MKEKIGVNRRQFLASTSAAAIGAAGSATERVVCGNQAADFSIGGGRFDPLFPQRACNGIRSPAVVHE